MSNDAPTLTLWNWIRAGNSEEIKREANRYCPELRYFGPSGSQAAIEVFEATTFLPGRPEECRPAIYGPDYKLVRLLRTPVSPDTEAPEEIYGFYAKGDFRPLNGGQSFDELNRIGPLVINSRTALPYVLLRLSFELNLMAVPELTEKDRHDRNPISNWAEAVKQRRLAKIVTNASLSCSEIEADAKYNITFDATIRLGSESRKVEVLATVNSKGQIRPQLTIMEDFADTDIMRLFAPRRIPNATPVQEWIDVRDKDWKELAPFRAPELDSYLRDFVWSFRARLEPLLPELESHGKAFRSRLIFRLAPLSFYDDYCLLEVVALEDGQLLRSYALMSLGVGAPLIVPMNGTSPVLHKINERNNNTGNSLHYRDDLPPPADKRQSRVLPDTDEDRAKAVDYLLFFCWAVHGDEGPFFVPCTYRESPLAEALSTENADLIRDKIRDRGQIRVTLHFEDNSFFYRATCTVFYSTGAFTAKLKVQPGGMIVMEEDDPVLTDLKLHREKYGAGGLFVLETKEQTQADAPPDSAAELPSLGTTVPVEPPADANHEVRLSNPSPGETPPPLEAGYAANMERILKELLAMMLQPKSLEMFREELIRRPELGMLGLDVFPRLGHFLELSTDIRKAKDMREGLRAIALFLAEARAEPEKLKRVFRSDTLNAHDFDRICREVLQLLQEALPTINQQEMTARLKKEGIVRGAQVKVILDSTYPPMGTPVGKIVKK